MASPVSASPPTEAAPPTPTERGIDLWPIPCQSSTPRPPKDAYDRMIALTVGKRSFNVPPKTFHVYQGVLCHYSDYFKTMLKSGFQEGGSDNLTLDAVDPRAFQMFYDYMNTGDLILDKNPKWEVIVDAYIFADYHLAQSFKNRALDLYFASIAFVWAFPANEVTLRIYDNTSEESPLRKLQIDFQTTFCSIKYLDENQTPKAFLWDLLNAYKEKKKVPGLTPKSSIRGNCLESMKSTLCKKYHDHSVTEARPEVTQSEGPTTPSKRDASTAFGSDMMQGREGNTE